MAYLLIVDDDEDFALATQTALESAGHEVAIELSATNAVAVMERRRPDAVILDVMFPEDPSAGFALARRVRHFSDKLKDVPILMLTAVNSRFPLGFSQTDIDEQWLPVTDFLEKPVDLDILLKRVSDILAKRGKPDSSPGPGAQPKSLRP